MNKILRTMLISSVALGIFASAGTFFVSYVFDSTAEQIAVNKRNALLSSLHLLIKPEQHDNDIFTDIIKVTNKDLLGSHKPVVVYRARKNDQPVAVIINSVAPDGYSGNIELLVAILHDGTLAGVRVVQHRETPGLGDAIDAHRSDWIKSFEARSLTNPAKKGWAVKRDGGIFDQFTGATITPRAIVKAVHNTLLYYNKNSKLLFKEKQQDKSHE